MTEIVTQPLYVDYTLPPGWYRSIKQATDGSSAENWDVQIIGHGRRFRSKTELGKYIEESGITDIVAGDVDFTVWGKGRTPPQTPTKHKTDIISVSASKMTVKRPNWLNQSVCTEVTEGDDAHDDEGSDQEGDTYDGDSGIDSTPEKEVETRFADLNDVADQRTEIEIVSPIKVMYDMSIACPYCDKILSGKVKLNDHIKSLHPSNLSVLKHSITSPNNEMLYETPKGRPSIDKTTRLPIPCPYCDKILSRNDKLNQHIKTQHLGCPLPTKIKVEKAVKAKLPTVNKGKKKVFNEDTVNVKKKATEKAYSSDPLFVKFKFSTPIKRQRQHSEESIDLDISSVYASFAESPVVDTHDDEQPKKKLKVEAKIKKIKSKKNKKDKQSKTNNIRKRDSSGKVFFACPYCDKVLSRKDKLNYHMKTRHPASKSCKDKERTKEKNKIKVHNVKTDKIEKSLKTKTEGKEQLELVGENCKGDEKLKNACKDKESPSKKKNVSKDINSEKDKQVKTSKNSMKTGGIKEKTQKEKLDKPKIPKTKKDSKSPSFTPKKTSELYANLHANLSFLKKLTKAD